MSCGAKILLKDRYRALKLLGQGGFGKTFKAVDEDQPRKPLCVIKQFAFSNNHPETRQIALKLFYEEAQHLEALGKHDQIPELLAYFDVEGQPYLVQQFIDGQDLEQELATAGTFNQAKIRELLESLLPVLDFLHHQSPPVIHRDIKPANIIRRHSDGSLVLVDFGAAKQATQSMLAKTGTVIGSPEYTAPEQTRGKPVFASDIYSLGVTCIHLLTQVPPFDLFDSSEDLWVWRDYLKDNLVDENLGQLLDKMVANSLVQRYKSAKTVLNILQDNSKITYNGNSLAQYELVESAANRFDTSHIKQVLESIVSSSNLEFTAHKLGERLTQILTIQNNVSEIIIEGYWEIAPHPNDPPHTPNSHKWISVTPKTFNSNQIECLVTVDTSQLMADRVYKRDMILRTNFNQEIYQVALDIKTSPLSPGIRQIPWLNLLGLWVISAIIPALLIAAAYAVFIVFCVIAFGLFISTLRRD
jgi:serine/threonine protein kinase